MGRAIWVSQKDNVVTTVSNVEEAEEVTYGAGSNIGQTTALETIPFGHKMAISKISKGGDIIKYGEVIGRANKDIEAGQWIHTHNTIETYTPSRWTQSM
jgi:altronate dehydratase